MKDLTKLLMESAYTGNILSVGVPRGTDIPRRTLRKNGVKVLTRSLGDTTYIFPRKMNSLEIIRYLIGA